MAIAQVAALGLDLRTPEALDAIAQGFMRWYADDPADIGNQTAAVFSRVSRTPSGAEMAAAALDVHNLSGRSAGNGSLMWTGPVVLAYFDDPAGLVEAAMAISALTHYQDYAQEACAVVVDDSAHRAYGRVPDVRRRRALDAERAGVARSASGS